MSDTAGSGVTWTEVPGWAGIIGIALLIPPWKDPMPMAKAREDRRNARQVSARQDGRHPADRAQRGWQSRGCRAGGGAVADLAARDRSMGHGPGVAAGT